MSDLLTEADAELRQEKLMKYWHDYGIVIIAFIVTTILSTGLFSAYNHWDKAKNTEQTQSVIALQAAEDYPQNIVAAQDDLTLRAPLKAIAVLNAAGALLDDNNPEDARALYYDLATDTAIPTEFRHLAIIMETRLALNDEDFDADTQLALLAPTLKEDAPYRAHALIEAAIIDATANQDFAQAQARLNTVLDMPDLLDTLYARAQNLNHIFIQEQAAILAANPKGQQTDDNKTQ